MSAPSLSNVFSDVYISGNCTVKGTLSSLAGSITSQWTTSGSIIYYTSGNVGVGTAAPVSTFEVTGTGFPGTALTRTAASDNYGVGIQYSLISNTGSFRGYYARAFGGSLGTIATTNQNQANGYFGIDVANAGLFASDTAGYSGVQFYVAPTISVFNTRVGIGTTNPGSLLTVSGGGSFGSGYNAFTAPTGGLIVQGNVGIGTSNPGVNALQVSGNVVTSGFTSNATNTVFNYDTLTVPFLNATQVFASSITTATTGTALQVTGNLYATDTIASANPMMFRNRIINGDMRISQRGTSNVGVFATSCYFIDRMTNYFGASSGGYTAYQNTLSTNDTGPYQQGFRYSANVVITSTVTSNPVLCGQVLEGWTVQDFNWGTSFGSSVTISYWFKSSATGTFSHGIRNQGIYSYSYTGSFTYSTAGVWQYVSYTIPPPPTGSVWRTDNLGSWEVWVGGSFQGSAAAGWVAGSSFGLTGSANWYSTGGYIAYTGFQLEKGLTASPFEFRPYATELALCQRYYYQITSPTPGSTGVAAQVYAVFGQATGVSATGFWFPLNFPVTMRYPSFNVTNSAASNWQIYNGTSSISATAITVQTDSYTTSSLAFNCTVASGATAGNSYIFRTAGLTGTTTAYIGISCEL